MRIRLSLLPAVMFGLFPFTPCLADGPVNVSGTLTLVSDYRFRGISLSDEDPALQVSLAVDHESGYYGAVWGSTLDDTPLYGALELDVYGGW